MAKNGVGCRMLLANTYTNDLLLPYHLRSVLVPVASLDPLMLISQVMSIVRDLQPGGVVVLVPDLALQVADPCLKLSFQAFREIDSWAPPDFRHSVLAAFLYEPHCLRARRGDITIVLLLDPRDVVMQTVTVWIHWAIRDVSHTESCRLAVVWSRRAGSFPLLGIWLASLRRLIHGFGALAVVGHSILLIVFPVL